MKAILEIDGFLHSDGTRRIFVAHVTQPKPAADGEGYSCSVHAPLLFTRDKEIFGVNAEQARALAIQFLKSMLEGKHLTDSDGKVINSSLLR